MGKPFRSPLRGYNHNLSHLGKVFHVQTEDSGPSQPRLFTHLFFEGTILASRKYEYDPALPDDRVLAMMQGQHKVVIRDLMQAKFDERIIAFFATRGEDVAPPVQGAVPSAPLLETAGPPMVLPQAVPVAGEVVAPIAAASIEPAAAASLEPEAVPVAVVPEVPSKPEREGSGGVPVRVGSRRTSTRPIDTSRKGSSNPAQVVVRAADNRRPPFVRSGSGPVAKLSSTDGVVVQRSVVVGDPSAAPSRPARIRPPVPYVVTGGGHTERPPRAESSAVTQPMPAQSAPTAANAAPPATSPASPPATAEPHRGTTGAFGVGLADDKSLDEVILEYLSEDGE